MSMSRSLALASLMVLTGCLTGCLCRSSCGASAGYERELWLPLPCGQKWGYVSVGEKQLKSARYEWADQFSEHVAVIVSDGKYGMIRDDGTVLVEPRYQYIDRMSDGMALFIQSGGLVGYLDHNGEVAVPPRHRVPMDTEFDARIPYNPQQYRFQEGLAVMPGATGLGYTNRSAEFVIPPRYRQAKAFSQGRAAVRLGDTWGYLNRQGEFVIEAKYDNAHSYSEGLAVVEQEGQVKVIDWYGDTVFKLDTSSQVGPDARFQEGRLAVFANGKWGYLDPSGRLVIHPKYSAVRSFQNGLAPVAVRSVGKQIWQWGYIDRFGRTVVPHLYSSAHEFNAQYALVAKGGQWRRDGLVRNLEGATYLYIDATGRVVLSSATTGATRGKCCGQVQ